MLGHEGALQHTVERVAVVFGDEAHAQLGELLAAHLVR